MIQVLKVINFLRAGIDLITCSLYVFFLISVEVSEKIAPLPFHKADYVYACNGDTMNYLNEAVPQSTIT